MTTDIPLFEIAYDERDIENAVASIRRGRRWANGPFIDEFERGLESYLGVEHAVTLNSGTSALTAALVATGVGPGDEVVVPSFTFIATVNAVEFVGARPVFADIEPDTYGLDPERVRERITPETAAVVPVHCYGGACRIEELAAVADEHDLVLIEDAAEAMGADANGRLLGTFGDAASLSFCQNKITPTGEGGAVVTDDPDVARGVRLFRSHGRLSTEYFESWRTGRYVALGGNFRMPDVVAAIGCSQLERVEWLIGGRRAAAERLREGLETVDGVRPHVDRFGRHVYQLFTVELDAEIDRAAVVGSLAERGIASKVYWDPPVHRTDYYGRRRPRSAPPLPITDAIAGRVLTLPMHPTLSEAATTRIVGAVREAVERQGYSRVER